MRHANNATIGRGARASLTRSGSPCNRRPDQTRPENTRSAGEWAPFNAQRRGKWEKCARARIIEFQCLSFIYLYNSMHACFTLFRLDIHLGPQVNMKCASSLLPHKLALFVSCFYLYYTTRNMNIYTYTYMCVWACTCGCVLDLPSL